MNLEPEALEMARLLSPCSHCKGSGVINLLGKVIAGDCVEFECYPCGGTGVGVNNDSRGCARDDRPAAPLSKV